MLKHICIFLFFLTFASEVNANFWNDIANCFNNPCNCGYGNRIEKWNGQSTNKGPENILCPPWNKEGGRDDNICLVQFEYPPIFTPYWQRLCAESTKENSFFDPKIRVRGQQCNFFACWTTSNTLSWDGQCVTLAGPYGLPLTRMCARVASMV